LTTPSYPSWVRSTRLVPVAIVTGISAIGVALALVSPWFLLFAIPLVPAAYITAILVLSARRLGSRGGDVQRRVHQLIVTAIDPPRASSVLDVGCGSGQLAIALATASPQTAVTGVDSWGPTWPYSQQQCEDNARLEGVADRVRFDAGSGAALRFAPETFDTVVSCMTLHEVADANPRTRAIVEALRVLRPGGRFVFVDPFADPAYYRSVGEVERAVGDVGATIVRFDRLADLLRLPYPLAHPKVLGNVMLLVGDKHGVVDR
jgi:SAM-dependent methyltransferase